MQFCWGGSVWLIRVPRHVYFNARHVNIVHMYSILTSKMRDRPGPEHMNIHFEIIILMICRCDLYHAPVGQSQRMDRCIENREIGRVVWVNNLNNNNNNHTHRWLTVWPHHTSTTSSNAVINAHGELSSVSVEVSRSNWNRLRNYVAAWNWTNDHGRMHQPPERGFQLRCYTQIGRESVRVSTVRYGIECNRLLHKFPRPINCSSEHMGESAHAP